MLLTWTYRDRDESRLDIVGKDPERPIAYCRVYRQIGVPTAEQFRWVASDGHVDLGSGYAPTLGAGAKAAEAAYWPKR